MALVVTDMAMSVQKSFAMAAWVEKGSRHPADVRHPDTGRGPLRCPGMSARVKETP